MKGIEGSDERRAFLEQCIDDRQQELRLRWSQLARIAGMTQENLLRIRKNRISISWEAAAGIERAFQWEPGGVEAAVLHGTPPVGQAPDDHPELSGRPESIRFPPGWTNEEEAQYQELYPTWHPILQTQEMEFSRHAFRMLRDDFTKTRALEQFTQGMRSNEDRDGSLKRGTRK